MRGSRDQRQSIDDVRGGYADPHASLFVGCLDESVWVETARLGAAAREVVAWLARYPDIHLDAASEQIGEWCHGTARFRFQLLEVPPLDRKGADAWSASRRWKKQPHRLFVAALVSVEPG